MKRIQFNIKQQSGIGVISLIVGLCLIIVFTSMFVNVVPLYAENFSVESTLETVSEEQETIRLSNSEIKKRIMKRLSLSGVSSVNERNITIHRSPDSTVLQIAYEVRTHFLANIDFVVKFDDKEEVIR